ncbi:hypothetical protein FRC01_002768 [Tulasnella sp. 417]|nr:hypothetical protein FRC01_002768 [Tulasnella sp. 417]
MANELLGLSNYLALSVANDMWKRGRAHLKHALSGAMVKSGYAPLLETEARRYLERMAAGPENAVSETNRVVGEVIVKLGFGKLEDGPGRDYIQIITRLMEIMAPTMQGYVVDLFPALQYLPKWLPGMKFKRDAARWKREIRELEGTVFELMQENAVSNDPEVRSSFTYKKMQEIDSKYAEGQDAQQRYADEKALGYSGLQMFFGKLFLLSTTESTVQTFLYAMTMCPAVQKKAQAEIDRVDQSDSPYLHAAVLETLRWNPTVSFGLPHVSRKDDVYNGYFIPKGTTVMANAWGFTRNPKHYTNPSTFDPERYLKQSPELDPLEYVFGYGRRICPGKDLAFQEVWILAASVLWAFNVVGVEDELASLADSDRFSFATASRTQADLRLLSRPTYLKCQFIPRREGLGDKLGLGNH